MRPLLVKLTQGRTRPYLVAGVPMATIRTVMIAGAAPVALFAHVPEQAKAQTVRCPGAPLQIAPGASNPCVAAPKSATKKSTAKAKTVATTKTAAKTKAATKTK